MTNIDHDRLFKELLTTFFVEFLQLFFPEVLEYLDVDSIQFVDKELFTDIVEGQKKILDVVALAQFQAQNYSFLVHVEAQASNQTDFNQRMFRYFCNLFLKYNRPIYPIVIFSYDSPKRADKDTFLMEFPEGRNYYYPLQLNYKVIQLNRLNWRDFLKQQNPVAIALMSKMKIDKSDRPIVKAQCLRLLVSLQLDPAKMQLISGFVDSYLRLNQSEEQIFQSQLDTIDVQEKEQIMTITTSWELKGQVNTILRLLNCKLDSLSSETTSKIKSLNENQLNTLTEDLLDFNSLNDLNNWLESHV